MKKIIFLVLSIILIFPVVVNAAFSDVSGHWAESYINELTEKKVINGYTDGTFKPQNTITKGEFLKLIMTASLPEFDFSKSKVEFEHWAAPYVKVAENYGAIKKGKINLSNIDTPISRIEVVEILSLSDVVIRQIERLNPTSLKGIFYDVEGVLTAEQTSLLTHAVCRGFINGYEDKTFRPNNNLTRAEVSKIISVYMGK